MKYQKRYKPKTKFEKFLKVYFIIPLSVAECFLKIFSTENSPSSTSVGRGGII